MNFENANKTRTVKSKEKDKGREEVCQNHNIIKLEKLIRLLCRKLSNFQKNYLYQSAT